MKIVFLYKLFLVTVFIMGSSICETHAQPKLKSEDKSIYTDSLYFSFAFPLTGGPGLVYGTPVSDHLVLSSAFYYFDRDWAMVLESSDWHSRSGYIATLLQYYPGGKKSKYTGYFIGGDMGFAVSDQTYKPLDESDVFFFPFIDLYFFGYTQPLTQNFFMDICIGGGWAPVSSEVEIKGHRHDSGDFYPMADIRFGYRW